jgi:hypothetical protein
VRRNGRVRGGTGWGTGRGGPENRRWSKRRNCGKRKGGGTGIVTEKDIEEDIRIRISRWNRKKNRRWNKGGTGGATGEGIEEGGGGS